MEKDILSTIEFDLKIYTVFTPLKSVLSLIKDYYSNDETFYKIIETEILKLAQISFFDQLIFKYTHGAIAIAILHLVSKKRDLPGFKQILGTKINYEQLEDNKDLIMEIENELKNLEKKDLVKQTNEKRSVLALLGEATKRSRAENAFFPYFFVFLLKHEYILENHWIKYLH